MKDYVEVIINGDDYWLSVDELRNIIQEYEVYKDLELEYVFTSDDNLPPVHVSDRAIGMNYAG